MVTVAGQLCSFLMYARTGCNLIFFDLIPGGPEVDFVEIVVVAVLEIIVTLLICNQPRTYKY